MGPNGWVTVAVKRYVGGPYVPSAVPEDVSLSLGSVLGDVLVRYMTRHLAALGLRGAVVFRRDGFVWPVDPSGWSLVFDGGRMHPPSCSGPGMSRSAFESGPLIQTIPGPGLRVTWPMRDQGFLFYFDNPDPEHVLHSVRGCMDVLDVMSN